MKKIILIFTILLTTNFVSAQITSDGCGVVHYRNCDNGYLVEVGFFKGGGYASSTKIKALEELQTRITTRLGELRNVTVSSSECQKISQTLWEGKGVNVNSEVRSTGMDVILLNNFLVKQGLVQDEVSEYIQGREEWRHGFNQKTVNAVKKFQAKYGIKQTGAVGPITLAKINSMICGERAIQ